MNQFDGLGDRMKRNYEKPSRSFLTRRTPVILRLDGKAFHTFTRQFEKPFDMEYKKLMIHTTMHLCNRIQGAKFAYTQSDEISILLTDFDTHTTEAWFNYNIQKMCSVAASMASAIMNVKYIEKYGHPNTGELPVFDCRAFNIPEDEVANYFRWRAKDWKRNSILMLTGAHYSVNEMKGKKQPDMHEMLHQKGVNWAKLLDVWKNGTMFSKVQIGMGEDSERTRWYFSHECMFLETGSETFPIFRSLMKGNVFYEHIPEIIKGETYELNGIVN